jgi:hypothetical protein
LRILRGTNCENKVNRRAGASTVDYVLVLAVIFPMVAFSLTAGRRMMQQVFEIFVVMVSWPFM